MRKNKKLLMCFLALNTIISSYTGAATTASSKYDKMFTSMVNNLEKGRSNEQNYKLIEKVLNKRNKELKDLYKQSDYIVKPEYLEWQIFFSGFYEEYSKGVDNSSENGIYHSNVSGYYDENGNYVSTSSLKGGLQGKPYLELQKPKEIDLGVSIQVREPSREPITLGVTKPSMPLVSPNKPNALTITPPTIPSMPNLSFDVTVPGTFVPPVVGAPSLVSFPTMAVKPFNPVTPNVTTINIAAVPTLTLTFPGSGNGDAQWITSSGSVAPMAQQVLTGQAGKGTLDAVSLSTVAAQNFNLSVHNTQATGLTGTAHTQTNNGIRNFDWINQRSSHAVMKLVGSHTININNMDINFIGVGDKASAYLMLFHTDAHNFPTEDSVWILGADTNINMSGQKTILYGVQSHATYTSGSGMKNYGTITTDAETSATTSQGDTYTGLNPYQRIIFTTIDDDGNSASRYNRYFYFENYGSITLNGTSDILANFATRGGNSTGGTIFRNDGTIYLNGQSSVGVMLNPNVGDMMDSKVLLNSPLELTGDKSVGFQLTHTSFKLQNSIVNLNLGSIGNVTNSTGNMAGGQADKVEGAVGILVNALGNYTLRDYKINIGDHSLNNAGIRVDRGTLTLGTGGTNSSLNFSANSTQNAGVSITGGTSTVTTGGITINLDGISNVGVQAENNGTFNHTNGVINVNGDGSSGITTLSNATTNMNGATAIINVGNKSTGVYNDSIFNFTNGTITASGDSAIAVYGADGNITTNLNGGGIKAENGGIALYSGNNSKINLAGTSLTAGAGGLLFYNYNGGALTGKFVLDGNIQARVDTGGIAFYYKASALTPAALANVGDLKASFLGKTNLGVTDFLRLNMGQGSSLIYLETPAGTVADISDLSSLPTDPLDLGSSTWLSMIEDVPNTVKNYTISDIDLTLDNTNDSNLDTGIYGQIQLLSSSVKVNSGVTVAGTKDNQIAIVQRNKPSGVLGGINIINNGHISLGGDNTIGIAGDYVKIDTDSSSSITVTGVDSIGIVAANDTEVLNKGIIQIDGENSVGIFGVNTIDDPISLLGYGTGGINIVHEGEIKSTALSGERYGIYANNNATTGVATADSKIKTAANSKIDLSSGKGGVGIYANKSTVTHGGEISLFSDGTGSSSGSGIYVLNDSEVEITTSGSVTVAGDKGYGLFLGNSNGTNNGIINVNKESIGINVTGTGKIANNNNNITIGEASAGLYIDGNATGNNNTGGTINSVSDDALGIFIGTGSTGTNAGNVTLSGKEASGVYNKGTFTMTGGTITVDSFEGVGIYSNGMSTVTNINGGTINVSDGAIGLYANNAIINTAGGTTYNISGGVNGKSVFAYNYDNLGNITTGKINLTGTGNSRVNINAGGIAFYVKGMSLDNYIDNLITNSGTGKLELVMTDSSSNLYVLDSPGGVTQLSTISSLVPGTTLGTAGNVVISTGSISDYGLLTLVKGELEINQDVNLDLASDAYRKSDFVNSSVKLNAGNILSGNALNALGIGQRNYLGGTLANLFIKNYGTINLTGSASTGIAVDYGEVLNSTGALISVADNGIGIYAANSSEVMNSGTINLTNNGVGIYGANYFDGVTNMGYGANNIDITNSGSIVSTGTTDRNIGIYANNIVVTKPDSKVVLNTGSNIDVSGSEEGIGVYTVNSTLTVNDGNITVGKNGIGVYADNTTGTINGGIISLNGDNAIGYYLTNGSLFDNLGGTIDVNGQNIILMITDATSSLTLTNPFVVNSTPGSTYVVGNMVGGHFHNNTTAVLGSNGSLVNGTNTAVLFDTASNISSTGTNVSGMVLNGQHSLTAIPITVTEDGTNLGIINLGDSSAGMYLTGGARAKNKGTISVNNNSVAIYAEGSGAYIKNDNGIISIGEESTGLFLKDGDSISNTGTGEITGTSRKSVGMYSENSTITPALITNDNKIDLSGDQSIGIYTTGGNTVTNNGTILIGNSVGKSEPGVGIYADSSSSSITNSSTGVINVGENSIAVYNLNGNITNDGVITAGNGGTGIYSDGGTIILNTGSSITVGQNDAVGVYAVNQAGTVTNNSNLSVGDGSYGFVFTGNTAPSFINNQAATIGNNSIFTFSDSVLTAVNNGAVKMTGSDNIGFYLKNGGSFVNNADIIGNTGVSNIGVYAKGAVIANNADIILGDSILVEHTDIDGKKYSTGYSVGIYGENSNVVNNSAKTIQVGKDGIGVYVRGAGAIAENYGIINGIGDNAKGIFATDDSIVRNYGTINMTGDNVMGIVGQNGAQIYNDSGATINVTGNDVTGIYLSGESTKLVNNGTINITGTGMGISYTPTVELSNVIDTTGTSQGYTSKQHDLPEMPTLVNSGVINVNVGGDFNYDGFRVIITIDPSTNTPTTNSSNQVGFGGVMPDKLEVAPDFAVGTSADRYVFENIFKNTTGKGDYISQSLTWDATASGSSLVMTRKAYTEFTDGLWFEDFGKALNEKYAVTHGEGRKIFDKVNYITNEEDFRHIMASMAGNVYANINQRENDIARTFENSLYALQESTNNTKENVKINIIGGKGKNKEETDGVTGYDYETVGVLALREVERTYRHTFGYSLGYLHTGFEFKDGNESEEGVDTIQLGAHNKYNLDGWQLRNDLTGRVSLHNVDRNIDWPSPNKRSKMNGTYETYSITSDNILGKEFELGSKTSIMPYGAFRAMYVTRPTFEESGLEKLEVKGNDAWSVKPRVGIELKAGTPIGGDSGWMLKGIVDLAYEYELADLNEREKARLIEIEDGYHKLAKPEDEKGMFRTKASVGVEIENRYGIFLTGEYLTGNDKEDDYRAGIILKAVF